MATSADQPLAGEMLDTAYIAAATPWARYWSRSLDFAIWSLPAGIILYILLPHGLSNILRSDGAGILRQFTAFPIVLVLDAMCLAIFAQTPGRAIAGIRVTRQDGTSLEFILAVKRNFLLYFKGLALGLPIVSLFTMISAYGKVKDGKETNWDEKFNTVVVSEDGCVERTSIVAFLYVALTVFFTWLGR